MKTPDDGKHPTSFRHQHNQRPGIFVKYRDLIYDALRSNGADYCEIRIEETDNTRLTYRGKSLDTIAQTSGLGGNVRAVSKGGWGFASFNSLDDLSTRVAEAVAQAKAVGGSKTELGEVETFVDIVPAHIVDDPGDTSLDEKKRLMDHYRDLIWSVEGINSADIVYGDSSRKTFLGSSEGSYIEQQQVHVISRVSAQARRGGDVQQASFSLGSQGDYRAVQNLDEQVVDAAKRAVALLDAKTLKGGERTVILDPVLAGVFVHEAFGHLSEGDNVYENDKLKEIMYMGRKFGGKHLNITDGAAIPGLRGSFKYDDEGAPATVTALVREGELVGRLHSRETAAKLGEKPTGNARAIGFNFPPIVRMTNTLIEPGTATLEDLLEGMEDGVYVRNWYGGMTQHEMFTFSSGEAYIIRNGEIQEAVRPVMLTGNLFETLKNLDGVGNDLDMNQGGGCGKGGQMPLPVSNGSPHIRIQNCLISGA
ncbi:MAG: TldD/PmbA family protein [Chloroflexi bacterium]|nr:TldD/PmbA family protein [Chloroflexota bacterium]